MGRHLPVSHRGRCKEFIEGGARNWLEQESWIWGSGNAGVRPTRAGSVTGVCVWGGEEGGGDCACPDCACQSGIVEDAGKHLGTKGCNQIIFLSSDECLRGGQYVGNVGAELSQVLRGVCGEILGRIPKPRVLQVAFAQLHTAPTYELREHAERGRRARNDPSIKREMWRKKRGQSH